MALLTWRTTPGEIVRWPVGTETLAPDGWWVHLVWLPLASVWTNPAFLSRLMIFWVASSLTMSLVKRTRLFLVKATRQ
jgi:hypothetical protein